MYKTPQLNNRDENQTVKKKPNLRCTYDTNYEMVNYEMHLLSYMARKMPYICVFGKSTMGGGNAVLIVEKR